MVTKLNSFQQKAEFQKGRTFERFVAKLLKERGCYVVLSADYNGEDENKTPRLHGQTMGLVLPDLDVSKDGRRFWVEVKWKNQATLYRALKVLEHGINKRLYEHYLQVQTITGCPVWLFFCEDNSREILFGRLDQLTVSHVYDGDKMGRSGMVFFARTDLKLFYKHKV